MEGITLSFSTHAPAEVKPWTVTQRVFGELERELTIREKTLKGASPETLAAARALVRQEGHEAGERSRAFAVLRARRMVRHRIKAARLDYMLTLTYRENMQDPERLRRDWDAFRRRLRRAGSFVYVAVIERQRRGAFHLHIAVRGRQNVRLLRVIWRAVVGEYQGHPGGNVDVRSPFRDRALRHKLAAYLAKYVAKAFTELTAGAHRYWCSKGIEVPESVCIAWPARDFHEIASMVLRTLPPGGRLLCYVHEPTLTLCIHQTEPV